MSVKKMFRVKDNPLCYVAVAFCLFFLRWIFIGTGNDVGWDFETGLRAATGQVYGYDYYTLVGPLSYVVIGAVTKALGTAWFFHYCLYALCWAVTVCGLAVLLKSLSDRKETVAFALLAILPLSVPHLLALHLYNYMSGMFMVWVAVFILRFLESEKGIHLVIAGALAALAVFTKQNIGMGLLVFGTALVGFVPSIRPNRSYRTALGGALTFVVSFSLFGGALFYFFSRGIGSAELYRQMFVDAAAAKGNLATMLAAAFPRFQFGVPPSGSAEWFAHRALEVFGYVTAVAVNVFWYRHRKSDRNVSPSEVIRLAFIFVGISLCFVLLPLPWLAIDDALSDVFGIDVERNLLILFFWGLVVGVTFHLWTMWRERRNFSELQCKRLGLLLFASALCAVGCFSKFSYLFFGLPLLMGVYLLLTVELGLFSKTQRTIWFVVLNLCIYSYYPLETLRPLKTSDDPRLKGLLFSQFHLDYFDVYLKQVGPLVAGKRTLWLAHGGPYSLSGSLSVRGVSSLYFDQYPARIEPLLIGVWKANPPERIVKHWFKPSGKGFEAAEFNQWIEANYEPMDEWGSLKVYKRRE